MFSSKASAMVDRAALPTVLEEIASVAGWDAAWALAGQKGGQSVFIPARASQRHWLSKLVGFDAAKAICEHYRAGRSGHFLTIPSGKGYRSKVALVKALEEGASANQAAQISGMHKRSAFRARKHLRDVGADDLFPAEGKPGRR